MGVSVLKRKDRKNKARPANHKELTKQLLWKPIIRRVDVDAIKAEFAAKAAN
jgi:hypothetical protein